MGPVPKKQLNENRYNIYLGTQPNSQYDSPILGTDRVWSRNVGGVRRVSKGRQTIRSQFASAEYLGTWARELLSRGLCQKTMPLRHPY